MLRKFAFSLFLISLAAWCAFSMGCGNSNSTTMQSCTGSYDVVGDWNLTLNSTPGDGGVINTAGLALFFDNLGDVVAFPTVTGACSFAGTATLYESALGGGTTGTGTVQGSVSSATSISGSVSSGTGTANFTAAPLSPLTGSVTALSGSNWQGSIEAETTSVTWNITFTPTGDGSSMTFAGAGALPIGGVCDINGTLNQEGASLSTLNVFDVSVTFGEGCPFSNFQGLGFESSTDYFDFDGGVAGTYFYAIASNSATVLEIYPLTGPRQSRESRPQASSRRHFSFN